MMGNRAIGRVTLAVLWAAYLLAPAALAAGPYNEPGIESTDPAIVGWAGGYEGLVRGPMNIENPEAGDASFGDPGNALGAADCNHLDVVSLGDGGEITLRFEPPITDGPGADFAVFENGFFSGGLLYAELAFVEVSSDGQHFARFPSVSLTPDPVVGDSLLDPTDVYNLAGKHPGANLYPCQGTPFDLAELVDDPLVTGGLVDLERISRVRLVDVIGNGSTQDDAGRDIYDPFPTEWPQGGFDVQAVAVLNAFDCPDEDGDGYSPAGGGCGPVDCDDNDRFTHPGAAEDPGPPDRNCNGSDDCFIATAAYGTPFAAKIDLLRAFRDTYLMRSSLGRKAVALYYEHAPAWAAWLERHEWARFLARAGLAPVVGMAWLALGMP